MGEEFNIDSILNTEEIASLFDENATEETQVSPPEQTEEIKEKNEETTEVEIEDLFDQPESVGSGKEDKQDKEGTTSKKVSTSPDNFYSSIAKALKEDGIFPDLDDETLDNVETPEDFAKAVEAQIKAQFDEKQNRINEALGVGVENTVIQQYERTLDYLDSINNDAISDESEKGETLRKQLIYQDFINRGYSKERATREVQKSFNAGSDIEDAKEALQSNKDFFNDSYNKIIEEAKAEEEKVIAEQKKEAETLKKSILEDKNIFGDLQVDNSTRKKIYENISKPVYKDPKTGEFLTAIQKYEMENRTEFLKNIGLIYTLTDGFKNFDGLVKNKVKKEVRKGLSKLEESLNSTARNSDGSLRFVTGVRSDSDPSYFGKGGWDLDV